MPIHEFVGVGLYSVADAAQLLKAPPRTLRRWLDGYDYKKNEKIGFFQQANGGTLFKPQVVKQIVDMNHGKYLEEGLLDARASNFCIGVSGYPEKHFEAPNLKTDILHTKQKIDQGAEYVVTQMFFDNKIYFNYVDKCLKAGIDAPIIPGLKIITNKAQLQTIPKNFYINIPDELSDEVYAAKPEHVMSIGVEWATKQVEELLNKNVPSVHFYIMLDSRPITMLMKRLKLF